MKGKNQWRNLFFGVTACFLFISTEVNSQTYITPLIGAEATTLKENYISYSAFYFFDPFVDVFIPSMAIGLDVEKTVNEKLNLFYGMSYFSFETGKRYFHTSWGPNPYRNVKFKNFSQNLGIIYFFVTNLGAGFAVNIDYVTDFKIETTDGFQLPHSSLLYLGANLNLRYIWRNFVVKVDYKRGIFDVNNGNKKYIEALGNSNPLYPQKGFGFYLGYRFSF
ncbi:MAG: hypothetical protein EA362_07935 [Saprospirales bacterium]|nr:MAG: hypothetical protein EA362_07935 [Saprospirales bacterium]